MSLRHALRSRFRGDKDKENNKDTSSTESRDSSPWRAEHEEDTSNNTPQNMNTSPDEECSSSNAVEGRRTVFAGNPQVSVEAQAAFRDPEEKNVYEAQLNLLQEQLVAAMIENQTLGGDFPLSDTGGELSTFKEKNEVDRILKDLEYEKLRNSQLTQQLDEAKHHRSWSLRKRKLQRTSTEPTESDSRGSMFDGSESLSSDWVDVAQEATEHNLEDHIDGDTHALGGIPGARGGLWDRFHEWLVHAFYELTADFTEEPEVETHEDGEGDPLTVKKLKENIKRFRNDAKPIVSTVKGIHRLLMWRTPSVTLIAFMVYMYSVWIGWLAPVLLSLAIFKLSLNYLTYKGWNINIALLAEPEKEEKNKDTDAFKDLGMSDKFNLVVQVARQVQNTLGKLADTLEKLKNLLLWHQPESTMQLYLVLCVAFVLSCFFPGKTIFTLLALYMGVKMFIIEYIFSRFPRIKHRHDSTYRIWQGLPTDSMLERQYQKAAIDRPICVNLEDGAIAKWQASARRSISRSIGRSREGSNRASVLPACTPGVTSTCDGDRVHEDDKGFCELFTLPIAEHPLLGWRGGRRCTLINRDKSLTAAFKHGKLYLTRSFLCFERSKTTAMKNIVIPQSEITHIEKAKPYAWMPGGGMSIEVTVQDQDKPYMFGAILNRDECFDSIVANGLKANLPWAVELSNTTSPAAPPTSSGQSTSTQDTVTNATTGDTSATATTATTTTTAIVTISATKEGGDSENGQQPPTDMTI